MNKVKTWHERMMLNYRYRSVFMLIKYYMSYYKLVRLRVNEAYEDKIIRQAEVIIEKDNSVFLDKKKGCKS